MNKSTLSRIMLSLILSGSLLFADSAQAQKRKKKDSKTGIERISISDSLKSEYYFTEGERLFILEKYPQALEAFKKADELTPNNAAIQFKMGQVLSITQAFNAALPHANKALELDPSNKYYYLLLAQIQTHKGDYESVAQTYETMIENTDDAEEYYYELAAIYMYQKNEDMAIDAFKRVEEIYGLNPEVSQQVQKIYLGQGKLDEAIEEGKKLIDAYPSEDSFVLSLAEIMHANNRKDEAKEILESLVERTGSAPARMRLAGIYSSEGEEAKAAEQVSKSFADPKLDVNMKVDFIVRKMKSSMDSTQYVELKELSDLVMNSHPDEAIVYTLQGDLEFTKENRLKALEFYKKSLGLDGDNLNIWQNVINIELENNMIKDAIESSEQAIERYPNQSVLYFFGGTAYLMDKEYAKAERLLKAGLPLSKSQTQLYTLMLGQLGDVNHGLENFKESDKYYELALESDPESDHVLNNYSYYLSLRKENLEKAKEMSGKLVLKFPNNATYLDTHGWVLYQLGEYSEAEYYLKKAVDEEPSGTIHEHYGDVLYKLDRKEEALGQWKLAIEKGDEISDLLEKKIAEKKLYE